MRNRYYRPKRRAKRRIRVGRFAAFLSIVAAAVVISVVCYMYFNDVGLFKPEIYTQPTSTPVPYVAPQPSGELNESRTDAGIIPMAVDSTQPSAFGFVTDIQENGAIVETYNRAEPISFPPASQYTDLKGISTFRGNNYRNTASWGAVNMEEQSLARVWNIDSGSLTRWLGSGWTGQPLIIQWDADMRQIMNLYPDKKTKETLVEVIYPTMDGNIYFLDLDDGSYTRDPINMGFTVKGTASVDPRGYPLLYVGQGVGMSGDYNWDDVYMRIYSLIDGTELWRYGAPQKDDFAHRVSWQAYDSSPLISADADTLVWPGENGVLYTIVLNSDFDKAAGTVHVSPSEPVKYRYTTPLNSDDADGVRWYGMENSAAAWKNYLYFTDNGGWLQCVDLNTMELVFAQDVMSDSDCSPLLETVGDQVYIYTGCGVDNKHDADSDAELGSAYIRKINGLTGEIIWEVKYDCYNKDKVAGGILASPMMGYGNLDGLVIFSVSRVEDINKGVLVALNKETGEKVWEQEMKHYSWSSPVGVYTSDGTGYIIHCDSNGDMSLRDGANGNVLDTVNLGENVEASPTVFNNMAVVGTKGEKIYGVRIE